jgi:hypothetical protein
LTIRRWSPLPKVNDERVSMSRTALPADCESGCPYLRSGNAWTPSRLPMAKAVPPSCESWGEPASNARPPVANEHSLTGATLGLPVLPSDRGQFLLRPPETSTRCKTQECARDQLLLDLLAEDSRLNVYAGKLEVRPPGAPTTQGAEASTERSLGRRHVLGRNGVCWETEV